MNAVPFSGCEYVERDIYSIWPGCLPVREIQRQDWHQECPGKLSRKTAHTLTNYFLFAVSVYRNILVTSIIPRFQYPVIMTLTDSQKAEVKTTMEAYAAAYKNKDILGLLAVFSPEICGFGSGPDEVVTGRDSFARQVQRDMSQATVNGVVFTDTQIFGDGRVAWLMTKSAISFSLPGEKMQTLQGRSTMVMRNTGSRWQIEQIHFSLPYGGQQAGQSFPGA